MNELLENAINQLKSKNIDLTVIKQLSLGKEATVYLVEHKGKKLALKVYKDYLKRSFQKNRDYIEGKYIRRPSERKAISRRNKFGKKLLHRMWVKREFYMLRKLFASGVNIPEPIAMTSNSILMDFIGDGDIPAPLLKDVKLEPNDAKRVYEKLRADIRTMKDNGIVHGDLSPFNILFWKGEPYIIDFPQSLDIRNNPNCEKVLQRDIKNIDRWYEKIED